MSDTTNQGETERELEARVRTEFQNVDPIDAGTRAAHLLSSAIALQTYHLLGAEADEDEFIGGPIGRECDAATTAFAQKVACLVRFAQTGETDAEDDRHHAAKAIARTVSEALFAPAVLTPAEEELSSDEWIAAWWIDPGPIDLCSSEWPIKTALHLARARILEREGEGGSPLPVRAVREEHLPLHVRSLCN
jgi:hypothetical protein